MKTISLRKPLSREFTYKLISTANIVHTYFSFLTLSVHSHKRGGFGLTKARCDNEFQAALDPIVATYDPPITVNYANPQEPVLQANGNNRFIKEHFAWSIIDYRLTGFNMKWLSTWDLNQLGSRICFQKSTGRV